MLISAYLASMVMHLVFSGLFSLKLSSQLKRDDYVEQRDEIKDLQSGRSEYDVPRENAHRSGARDGLVLAFLKSRHENNQNKP